jgi:hypothetical protein
MLLITFQYKMLIGLSICTQTNTSTLERLFVRETEGPSDTENCTVPASRRFLAQSEGPQEKPSCPEGKFTHRSYLRKISTKE